MAYKHGIYGEAQASNYKSEEAVGTLPVYIGTLPIHRLNTTGAADFDYSDYINKPILVSSYKEVENLGIYSDDWETYTLCEVIYTHFMNGDDVISPIVLINMFDPATAVGETAVTKTVTVSKEGSSYVGYIDDPLCVIDDIVITAEIVISPDASGVSIDESNIVYTYDGDRVAFAIKSEDAISSVTATYKAISFKAEEIAVSDFKTAVNAVDYVEALTGKIPTILVAPSFSQVPAMHDVMIQKAIERAADKWYIICVSDIPADETVNSVETAIAWKKENQYNSKHDKVCFPMVANGKKVFHLSTLTAFEMQLTDFENGETPHISPSNRPIAAEKAVLKDGTVMLLMEREANELNKVGITTVNLIKQQIRLWGSHMSNYNFDTLSDIKPEDRFDASVRMMGYILNYLQYNYIDEIDRTFSRKDIDSILNSVQNWFDSLVNEGKLLYAEVSFDEASNTIEQLENGDLTFDIKVTYGIITKSITFRLQYTRAGIITLLSGGEE